MHSDRRVKRLVWIGTVLASAVILAWALIAYRAPVGDWVEAVVNWLTTHLDWLFDFISAVVKGMTDGLETALLWPPYYVLAALFALLGWKVRGFVFGAVALTGFLLLHSMLLWDDAMSTLSLVLVSRDRRACHRSPPGHLGCQ